MSQGAIPSVRTGKPDLDKVLLVMKQAIDRMSGAARNSTPLGRLPENPTNAEIAVFVNQLADRLDAG